MDYLIRFVQLHETFRQPETRALAELASIKIEFLSYLDDSPFCLIRVASEDDAKRLIQRSILAGAIYELWGTGPDYETLHADVKIRSQHIWNDFKQSTFKFRVHGYQGGRSNTEQRDIIESFKYVGFEGAIRMKDAENEFVVFEEYARDPNHSHICLKTPHRLFLARFLTFGGRTATKKFDLKKRRYINTTSMDSELALLTANIAQAQHGKLFYDPFCGTGSFPIACSYFGAITVGSDLDARVVRGKPNNNITTSFGQYGLGARYIGGFICDITNSPVRLARFLDGIVCDPPYGIREGVKVLGRQDGLGTEEVLIDGIPAHYRDGYVAPKKAYSFDAMIEDILDFAAITLVDGGRLSMWMPVANDQDIEIAIPQHPCLTLESVCLQEFNKWSRRLLTYSRISNMEVGDLGPRMKKEINGNASALNSFRKRYFAGFKPEP